MRRRPAPSLIVTLTALVLALTACADSGAESSASGPGDRVPLAVGIIPIIDAAPLYLGIEKGFFASRGLDVTPVPAAGGAVMLPAVLTGQNQFGFSNVVSLLAAREAGLPLISVAGGASSTGSAAKDVTAVLVESDAPMRRPRDLEGKRVAINSLNNIGDASIRTSVERDGGDPDSLEFVEVPFPQMAAQLARGAVDAVWATEPFVTQTVATGGRVLFNSLTATYPNVQIAQYFTTEDYRAENPEVVRAFVAGINDGLKYAAEHPAEVREIIGTYTKIPPQVAAKVVLPNWPRSLDRESTLALGIAARKYGTIDDAPDVDGLLGLRK